MHPTLEKLIPTRFRSDSITIPVVRLHGPIGMASPLRPGMALSSLAGTLEKAFSFKAPAVALAINSPGGSPVQSRLIHNRIRALAAEKEKQVFAYIEDVGASGGYMLALAGDAILADPSSIVGSIGVVSGGFGLDRFIERFGIERRLYTAGERKAVLDPFQPEDPEDVAHLKALQREVHAQFIALVRERRGDALSASEDLFSGLFWSGETAAALGLVDGLGDMRSDLRRRFGDTVKLKVIGSDRGRLRRMVGLGAGPAVSADDVLGTIEARALWQRYGL
jgi:signal peptide peptidase SppA